MCEWRWRRRSWPVAEAAAPSARVRLRLRRGQGVDLAGEAALVPGRRVVVHDALLGGLVDLAHGLGQELPGGVGVPGGDGGAELLHLGLDLRHVLPVANPALEALPVLLQGRRVT